MSQPEASKAQDPRVHPVAQAFSLQTDAYEAARPSYPLDAVKFLLEQSGIQAQGAQAHGKVKIVDLAAGTGKFTRLLPLENPEIEVIAVEPAVGMRTKFAELLPRVPILDGTAESLPFETGSVDLITVAQGFHWFANLTALKEIHRVLKPHGSLALIWNMEDPSVEWVAQLRKLYEAREDGTPQYRLGWWKRVWQDQDNLPKDHSDRLSFSCKLPSAPNQGKLSHEDEVVHGLFHQSTSNSADKIWQRVLSKSYISKLEPSEAEKVREEVFQLLRSHHPQLFASPPEEVNLPYTTDVFVFKKKQ